MEKVLKIWKMRNLTLKGKITVFKSLALPKNNLFRTGFANFEIVINVLENVQKQFAWRDPGPKIKHEIICNTYKKEELKNVDFNGKIRHLQCSWIQDLYDDSFQEWKLNPLYLIEKLIGKNFIFHSTLNFKISKLTTFSKYYRKMLMTWKKISHIFLKLRVVFDRSFYGIIIQIKTENTPGHFKEFSEKNVNYINQLVKGNGDLKHWKDLKREFYLNDNLLYKWLQFAHAILRKWKHSFKQNLDICQNLIYLNHQLINRLVILGKLDSKELYNIIMSNKKKTPTSETYF